MAFGRGKRSEQTATRVREGLRLSPNEERYVLAETLTGQVYAVPSGARFKGPLPFDKLVVALQDTCDRHEARRTGYERQPDGSFTKYVEARATIHLERLSMPGATDAEIMAAVNAHTMRKGDLSPGQLHRFILIELGPDDHVFAFALHHATADGVAFGAFVMEVYARLLDFPVPDAPGQYSDFWNFDWTASEAYAKAEAFWQARLGGVGDPGAWPEDRARSHSRVRLSERTPLSPEVMARTQAAAAAIGVTHFTYFYAVFLVQLSRMIGSATVVTTFQSAGRKGFEGADRAQGVFSNSLIIATEVDATQSIASLAQRLRGEVREAIAHEIYPYHHVIRTTGVRARYAMNWMPPMGGTVVFDDIQIVPMLLNQNQDDDDLNLRFGTYAGEGHLTLYYDPSAYEAPRVAAAVAQIAALADALAEDVHRPVDQVGSGALAPSGLLPDPEAALATAKASTIFADFLARAAETPDAVAISCEVGQFTYAEVEVRSRALAQRLVRNGVGAGDRVAILAERGPAFVWSMLAVARTGATFVVLDSAYPEARLNDLMAIAAPGALIQAGDRRVRDLAHRLSIAHGGLLLDAGAAPGVEAGVEGLDAARPTDPAYILFTSGSTERPKGVAVSHQPLAWFTRWQARQYGLTAGDRVSLLSGLSHDPVLRDVFTPLSLGATVCIPPAETLATPGGLARWLAAEGVTVMHLTPQMGALVTAGAGAGDLPGLREVFWGGDRLRRETVAEMAAVAPGARQTSFYGATETPQAAAACPVDATLASDVAPLGHGIEGVQLLVVDAEGRPLGLGEPGQIAVRSTRPSLGYVDKGRIVAPPDPGLYLTGDRGLYLPDGGVMLVGRLDDQLKIRGHRVEPAEIAALLRARSGVRDAVVIPVGEGDDLTLTAFVSGGRELAALEDEMKASLAARLPAHMVPARVVWMETLPLGPNGKVRREALLEHLAVRDAPPIAPAPAANGTERALIQAWSLLLGGRVVTRSATFASLGGDSLSYVRVYLATEEIIGDPPEGWPLMTVAELAATTKAVDATQREMDSAILLRAAAITLVVTAHYGLFDYGGGATGALMLISGFLFGGMGLSEVFRTRTAGPAFRVLANILIPTVVMSLAIWLFRLPGRPAEPYVLMMTADLQDWRTAHPQDLPLWFVHALIHIMAFVAVALLGLQAARRLDVGRERFLMGLFALGCVGRFLFPVLLDPTFFQIGVRHLEMIHFLPTTHLATFALGGLAASADTPAKRRRLLPVVVAYVLLSAPFYGPGQAAFVLASGLLLMFLPRLKVPRTLAAGIFAVAGASLWIYLTHVMVRDGLTHLRVDLPPAVGVVLALLVGVGVAKVWGFGARLTRRLTGRDPTQSTVDATI